MFMNLPDSRKATLMSCCPHFVPSELPHNRLFSSDPRGRQCGHNDYADFAACPPFLVAIVSTVPILQLHRSVQPRFIRPLIEAFQEILMSRTISHLVAFTAISTFIGCASPPWIHTANRSSDATSTQTVRNVSHLDESEFDASRASYTADERKSSRNPFCSIDGG
jgi:hypothetical protein